jgi:hypothetical protein
MEKEIGKIPKNDTTDIVIRVDEYKSKKGLTIREFVTSEGYTGFTRSGVRIPAADFIKFRDLINSIDYNEFMNVETKKEEEKKEEEKKSDGEKNEELVIAPEESKE